jgi:hypothetical protein
MRYSRWSTALRTVTWLAVAVTLGLSADLVEDALFEVDEAAAAEEEVQAGAADDVTVPSPRLAGSGLSHHSFVPMCVPASAAADFNGSAQTDLSRGLVWIHGPPWAASSRSTVPSLPLRI